MTLNVKKQFMKFAGQEKYSFWFFKYNRYMYKIIEKKNGETINEIIASYISLLK